MSACSASSAEVTNIKLHSKIQPQAAAPLFLPFLLRLFFLLSYMSATASPPTKQNMLLIAAGCKYGKLN
jgi:hypothetical protein